MNIVYDKSSCLVLASSASNNEGTFSQDVLGKMFPEMEVAFCTMDVPLNIPVVGCRVHIDKEIPFRLTNEEEIVFQLSDDEFERRIRRGQEQNRQRALSRFPCDCSRGNLEQFLDKVRKLPQTSAEVSEAMRNGSYFDQKLMKVGWWGSITDAGGYACMNREIIRRLHNHHIIPYVRMYSTVSQIDPPLMDLMTQYSDLDPKKGAHPFVYAYTPMPHDYHGGKRIFFTMMETASLHPIFVDHCNRFCDEVWVPSVANKQVFEDHGVRKRIRVIPLGIDEITYFQSGLTRKSLTGFKSLFGQPVERGLKGFKFLTVIQWNWRKGYDALIRAFVNAFGASDDVCLVIGTQYSEETVLNDLRPFLPRGTNLPQVVLYNSIIPTVDMPGFYRNFDCYVHMSRGEGFSLTQIEAAACGLPVISNFHSGMTEYLREDNSFIISCDEIEKSCDRLSSICLYYQGQYLWKVGQSQVDQATDYMMYVVDNYDDAKQRASVMCADVVNKYTWEKTTQRVAAVLKSS